MARSNPQALNMIFAKLAVLEQLVRLLLRERAAANDQTSEDIRRWGEEIKQFFEDRIPPGTAESHLTAAVDAFFTVLAIEVEQSRGNR